MVRAKYAQCQKVKYILMSERHCAEYLMPIVATLSVMAPLLLLQQIGKSFQLLSLYFDNKLKPTILSIK